MIAKTLGQNNRVNLTMFCITTFVLSTLHLTSQPEFTPPWLRRFARSALPVHPQDTPPREHMNVEEFS